jgi:DNA polymerase III epsilon subunit-like protein
MKLFFDTETTGLPIKDLPIGHPTQPYIVQLAAILVSENNKEVCALNTLINNGIQCIIPPDATKVHGITTEFACRNGIAPTKAISLLSEMICNANRLIGHNIEFDITLFNIACCKIGMPVLTEIYNPTRYEIYCTMKRSTNIVGIPHNHGGGNKYPKLTEAYRFAFGEDFDNAHDAMADVRATMRLYHWLQEQHL